jgi:anti-sigma regulatory factor (Ser/Thr protein kinase)
MLLLPFWVIRGFVVVASGTPPTMVLGDSRMDLPSSPTAARMARAFIRHTWEHLETADTLDAVSLCVSELVTNALDHGLPPYELCVNRRGGRLRVEVADASEREPVLQPAAPWDHRGRGIFLVERVATCWGVEPTSRGKRVWAEFATS